MQTKTATKANQLIAASARATLDPFEEIDWSLEVQDDDWFHLPPEKLPLYGTPAWTAMTEAERRTYSRHECAALCAAGIWFENRLMTIVLEHLADLPVTDPSHRYLLVEIADECRHSTMFGEYIRRAGTPTYAPANTDVLGDVTALPGGRALGYLLILAVEELLDVCNRATMRDERVHPLSRQVAKLHVLEEARHMSFAKTYLRELWPTLPSEEQDAAAELAPFAVSFVADLMVNEDVYAALGIPGGGDAARTSPEHRERIREDLSSLTDFLAEIGVIQDRQRGEWVERGLAA